MNLTVDNKAFYVWSDWLIYTLILKAEDDAVVTLPNCSTISIH